MMFNGWICGPKIYEFDGWLFEISQASGPWPLKKDLSLRAKAGKRFYRVFEKFNRLPKEDQEKYRAGGGCQSF